MFTFIEQARLGGRDLFFLTQSDMELSGENVLLRDTEGRVRTFVTPGAARAFAQSIGLTTDQKEATHIYELDEICGWCREPRPDNLNAAQLFMAWRLLEMAALATFPNALPGEPDWEADQLVTKLLTHLTEQEDPPPGWERHPWTAQESRTLGDLLGPPVERLAAEFKHTAA